MPISCTLVWNKAAADRFTPRPNTLPLLRVCESVLRLGARPVFDHPTASYLRPLIIQKLYLL